MEIGKAFTFVFEDKDWIVKLLIGGGILLLGIIFSWVLLIPLIAAVAVLLGYMLLTLRNVYDGNTAPLPKWENFGELFVRGITAAAGLFIWSIPVIVLSCCAFLPTWFASAANNDGGSPSGIMGLFSACLWCVTIVVSVAISVFAYAPLTNFALNNQLNTFWDFRGNWKFIQQNMGNYLIAWLMGTLVAGLIASIIGSVSCGLLAVFASFWSMLVAANLFGQYARAGMAPSDPTMMLPPSEPPMAPPPPMSGGPMEPAPSA